MNSSAHTNTLRCGPLVWTWKVPVPRTSSPRWRTVHRTGGSQFTISMVSVTPIPPTPVNASNREPTLRPLPDTTRTVVAGIHSRWRSQSVNASHVVPTGAATSTDATSSLTARLAVLPFGLQLRHPGAQQVALRAEPGHLPVDLRHLVAAKHALIPRGSYDLAIADPAAKTRVNATWRKWPHKVHR